MRYPAKLHKAQDLIDSDRFEFLQNSNTRLRITETEAPAFDEFFQRAPGAFTLHRTNCEFVRFGNIGSLFLPWPVQLEGFIEHPHARRPPDLARSPVGLGTMNQAQRGDLIVDESANRLRVANSLPIKLYPSFQFFGLADVEAQRSDAFAAGN